MVNISFIIQQMELLYDPQEKFTLLIPGINRIRIVYINGTITKFAGDGFARYSGDDEPATSATLRENINKL